MAVEKMERKGRIFLEIGVGERGLNFNLPYMRRGDKYIAVDFSRFPTKPHELVKELSKEGIASTFAKADGFSLPLRSASVDRTMLFNVISEKAFPNSSGLRWERKNRLTVQQALEKLEAELHRVTKPSGSVQFKEHYTPSVLWFKIPFVAKSRLDRLKEIFGPKWEIEVERDKPNSFSPLKVKIFPWLAPMIVTMRKK